jgi:hypothetical protein
MSMLRSTGGRLFHCQGHQVNLRVKEIKETGAQKLTGFIAQRHGERRGGFCADWTVVFAQDDPV